VLFGALTLVCLYFVFAPLFGLPPFKRAPAPVKGRPPVRGIPDAEVSAEIARQRERHDYSLAVEREMRERHADELREQRLGWAEELRGVRHRRRGY